MNALLLAIQAIAILCGPRVQSGGVDRAQVKECQVQMLKCVQSKQGSTEAALSQCVVEVK